MASSIGMPPRLSAGKNFSTCQAPVHRHQASVGVAIPGITGTSCSRHQSTTFGSNPGETMNCAPAAAAFCAWATESTVPAADQHLRLRRARSAGWPSSAASVRKVISAHGSPPSSERAPGLGRQAAVVDLHDRDDSQLTQALHRVHVDHLLCGRSERPNLLHGALRTWTTISISTGICPGRIAHPDGGARVPAAVPKDCSPAGPKPR